MEHHGCPDDPLSTTATTILTLPLTDFPTSKTASAHNKHANHRNNGASHDDDDLILLSLPPADVDAGGPTLDALLRGDAYILGDTAESDIHDSLPAGERGGGVGVGVSGSIEPVAARLLVAGRTYELTRVETSNTYVAVPPRKKDAGAAGDGAEDGSHKRQKLDGDAGEKDVAALVTRPARSIGLVPGEDSPACFFLEPLRLQPGHAGCALRETLSRWVYDPFEPPTTPTESAQQGAIFGYTVPELAHICRASQPEIEHAVRNRVFGAENAMAMPSSGDRTSIRYGMLSEEGRQTVSMAIISVLLETDLELVWQRAAPSSTGKKSGRGTQISALVAEIRAHWQSVEGAEPSQRGQVKNPYLSAAPTQGTESQFGTPSQAPAASAALQLPDAVIRHCLRPLLDCAGAAKDAMPDRARLVPDEVAKLAAHHVFLAGTPRAAAPSSRRTGAGSAPRWEEEDLVEAWSLRLPAMTAGYEPRTELLRGIALAEVQGIDTEDDRDDDAQQGTPRHTLSWQYFPEAGLPPVLSQRLKSMFAQKQAWTAGEAVPYLDKFLVGVEAGDPEGLRSRAAGVLKKCAKAIHATEQDGEGREVSVTKYVAMPH